MPRKSSKDNNAQWRPMLFLVAFCVFVFGFGWFMWVASGSKKDVRPRTIEKQQLQDELGLGSDLTIDKKPNKPAKIRFMLRDKDKKPVQDATVHMNFMKEGTAPITTALTMVEAGVYRAEIPLPVSGLWNVAIIVQTADSTVQMMETFNAP